MISIIIPTFNRLHSLRLCLERLSPEYQLVSSLNYEIIVSDDSEDQDSKSMIETHYKWVKWVKGPRKGPAANRNNGAKYSEREWLLFIDDDCLAQYGYLAEYLKMIQKNTYEVLEGKTISDRPKMRFDEESPINIDGNKLWSCNFAIKKKAFYKLCGFDESFPFASMEDVDFYERVVKHFTIFFVNKAVVIHPWRRVPQIVNFNKHLKSHIYIINKYNLNKTKNFRLKRIKLFIGCLCYDFLELIKFSFKGWLIYLENTLLNFILIFV